ncbi:unnamed protein product [Vitrella brassicaformis CCMP3155]|uniref:Uncharacterized protein n=2 Tax=Vitrella brassicaformis TaxID=1169539 RepID=A0A0G4G898_VITBC|nr:unnamed protein product [Vitrella brassicaformis CCMP3155]|eukprot:CEM24569.1 unnamed protein product [Vitrella brassicaformis CCMP3155]
MPMLQNTQQQRQQQEEEEADRYDHPVSYLFVGRRTLFLLSIEDTLRLRGTCRWLRNLFRAPQLRQRLTHTLSTQTGLLCFDDEEMGVADLLAAVSVMEVGGDWCEVREALELAEQCGYCQLPVVLTAADLHRHTNMAAYLAGPRVLAQLKMVGHYIGFPNNDATFELFQHGDQLRAIKDQSGFELTIDPPLPANHLYQQRRLAHNPPVSSRFGWNIFDRWRGSRGHHEAITDPSVSSFVKRNIFEHFFRSRGTSSIGGQITREMGDDRLHRLLEESPHEPVDNCTLAIPFHSDNCLHYYLRLTPAGHPFLTMISMSSEPNDSVVALLWTTERPVVAQGGYKDLHQQTAALAPVMLGPVIAPIILGG